jgi:hypothetical protein
VIAAAGIWASPAHQQLTVVLVRPDGERLPPIYAVRTHAARDSLMDYLVAFAPELAVTDSLARQESVTEHLRGKPLTGWLVPDSLLDAIAQAAGLGPTAARSRAAILARLPGVPAFKHLLRPIPAHDPRQLVLLR